MAQDNGGRYSNRLYLNAYTAMNLPLDIIWENNIYLHENLYNHKFQIGPEKYENKEFIVEFESYIHRLFSLYKGDKSMLEFKVEGGYDPYTLREHKRYSIKNEIGRYKEKKSYSVYTLLELRMKYKLTDTIDLKSGVAAEYRNWDIEEKSKAKNWRWQPQVFVMIETKF